MATEIIHDSDCAVHNEPALPAGPCDCEAGRLAKMCEGMTAHESEIARSWDVLEGFGFPPEASGWPLQEVVGRLPDAIRKALDCLVRQRDGLLVELQTLRR